MAYAWLTYVQARAQLAARLADTTHQYWVDAENGLYIIEALRTWNALTFTWKQQFVLTVAAGTQPVWVSLGTASGSPRLRTVTDIDLYTLMEYQLLEPPTGGTWTGTSQFQIADLSQALSRCRDEAIQAANCNQANPSLMPATPGDYNLTLPDNVLDVARARFIPTPLPSPQVTPGNVTLMRTDDTALNYYQTGYRQTPPALPSQYNVASLPPLTLQVDVPSVYEGGYDLITLVSGGALVPPTPSLLHVPDDNSYVLKWGALADLLAREGEATDISRAQVAKRLYEEGLKLMTATPWVMEAWVNGVAGVLASAAEMDMYAAEWDSSAPDLSTVVICGTDFLTLMPDPAVPSSALLTVLGNAPVPSADGDFIQCSRDEWDAVLDYAQFLAMFKQGGEGFATAQALAKNFFDEAVRTNGRLEKLGLYGNFYDAEGMRQIRTQERFAAV